MFPTLSRMAQDSATPPEESKQVFLSNGSTGTMIGTECNQTEGKESV